METCQQKKRRLFGRFHSMEKYLKELNRLLNVNKSKEDIWSIEESDASIERSKTLEWILLYKEIFPFNDKVHLKEILQNYIETWDKPYRMFIPKSEDCGLVCISSLHEFNWDFNFYDESGGIICLERIDYKVRIILDYYEDKKEYLEILIYNSL